MRLAYLHGNAFYKLYKGCIKLHVGNDCCQTTLEYSLFHLFFKELSLLIKRIHNASECKGSFVLLCEIYVSSDST